MNLDCWIHNELLLLAVLPISRICVFTKPLKIINSQTALTCEWPTSLHHVTRSRWRYRILNYTRSFAVIAVHPVLHRDREQMRLLRRCLWCPPAVRDNNQMWRGEFDTCKSAHCGQLPGWSILLAGTEPERECVTARFSNQEHPIIWIRILRCSGVLLCIMFPFLGFKGVTDCSDLDFSASVEFKKQNRGTSVL